MNKTKATPWSCGSPENVKSFKWRESMRMKQRYGSDRSWEDLTGHEVAFHNQPLSRVYDYDAASDGPEVEVIGRILSAHANYELLAEMLSTIGRRAGYANPHDR
jgi:hypothetical protein